MKKILSFAVALSVAAVFGGTALVQADCPGHKTQAAVDNATPTKEAASTPAIDKTVPQQVQTAQTDKPATPTPEVKK
jgi:hypothetical protein